MLKFAKSLSETSPSRLIQDTLWIIPVVQCIHILAIATIMGSVLMTNLRILGIAGRSQTMTATARRFLPWLWWSLLIALLSGAVMIVGEPVRELVNFAFWAKMALIAVSVTAAVGFQSTLTRRVAFWERNMDDRRWVGLLAGLSSVMWIAVVVLGRWIAYVQTVT